MSNSAKPLLGWLTIVALGALTGLLTAVALTLVRPVLFAFALGGLIVFIPTLLVREKRAYWLFLLVLSIPIDISKRMTAGLVDPFLVLHTIGPPISGTVSLDLYLTDVILFAMVLPWLIQVCLKRAEFYFPKIGYLFILYLAWALIVLLVRGDRLALAMFEWCRQLLYFLSFTYIINNVVTPSQFRAVVLGLIVGFALQAGTIVTLYSFGFGMETNLLSGIYAQKDVGEDLTQSEKGFRLSNVNQYAEGPNREEGEGHKRTMGISSAPALAAYHLEFTLPLILACLVTAVRRWQRILFGGLFAAGSAALYLTFSRSGLVGFLAGLPVFLFATRRSELVSRRAFAPLVTIAVVLVMLSTPFIVWSVKARLETATFRLELLKTGLDKYFEQPILGAGFAGLNEGGLQKARGVSKTQLRGGHNYYLALLTEVGPIGFFLLLAFFWQIVKIAVATMGAAQAEMKLLLVSSVMAVASIAVHNLGDGFGGHVTYAMLFLFVGLIIAIARRVQAEHARAPALGAALTA
jgi:hypothetical protein